jgi:ribonuclease BN (tRNA processing enzyme)
MKIKFLGAHNCESSTTRLVTLLIDDTLALDAGGLTSSLTIEQQLALKGVLLTHHHYDHIRDIPALGMNALFYETSVQVYSTQTVRDALAAHWLNGTIYSNFLERPPENPRINFKVVEPLKAFHIVGYDILPVPIVHSIPAVGYQVTSPDGAAVFYTGDTGPDLSGAWAHVSPRLLITELTAPNRYNDFGRRIQHLTPDLLRDELLAFKKMKGYLPPVVLVHMNPRQESEIAGEIASLSMELETSITLAYEGLVIQI